jgi:hypothetical protein
MLSRCEMQWWVIVFVFLIFYIEFVSSEFSVIVLYVLYNFGSNLRIMTSLVKINRVMHGKGVEPRTFDM